MRKLLLLLAIVGLSSGCMGLPKVIDSLARDTNTVRIQIYNPIYGSVIIERNLKPQPLLLQSVQSNPSLLTPIQ